MTVRVKPTTKPKRRTHAQSEERQQFLVTVGFLIVIVLAVLSLIAAFGLAYYNDHFRAVARVEGTEISRDQWRERVDLLTFRSERAEARAREALTAGHLSETDFQTQFALITEREQQIPTQALQDVVDLTFQGKLAAQRGITVSAEEVDTAQRKETSTPERRRVQVVVVQPGAVPGAGPEAAAVSEATAAERAAALEQARKALAEVTAGRAFADVARQYSTDPSKDLGGDIGYVTEQGTADPVLQAAVFRLPLNGTSEVIRGQDSAYRVARVTEIIAAEDDPSYLTEMRKTVSQDEYRRNLEAETLSRKLREDVVATAAAGPVEQLHLYEIVIPSAAQPGPGSVAPEDEARYAHVLYSPNDDPEAAASLPPTDPAWAELEKQAQATATKLRGITDPRERLKQLGVIAAQDSDDASSKSSGGLGPYSTRGGLAKEFGDALFAPTNKKYDVLGPVRTQFGYHVMMFMGRRASFDASLKAVQDAIAVPGADFAAIARQHSEGPNADEGGDLGWFIREQLEPQVSDAVLALQAGQTTAPIGLTDGTHIYKVAERAVRPLDVDQRSIIELSAFEQWYQPQKTQAEDEKRIFQDDAAVTPPTPDEGAPGGGLPGGGLPGGGLPGGDPGTGDGGGDPGVVPGEVPGPGGQPGGP